MRLYKYVGRFEVLRKIIKGHIRFTPPGQFNDPFEIPGRIADETRARFAGLSGLTKQTAEILGGLSAQTTNILSGRRQLPFSIPASAVRLPISYFSDVDKDKARAEEHVPDEKTQQEIIRRIETVDSTYGILSLTGTNTNLLMWAHYANDHRGAVIELELGDEFLDDRGHRRIFAGPVEYSPERAAVPDREEILMKHFFIKSPEWEYEQEFRIIRRLEDADKVIQPKRGPAIHLFELPEGCLTHIYFGVRTEQEDLKETMTLTQKNPHTSHIRFSQARLDPAHFELRFDNFTDALPNRIA